MSELLFETLVIGGGPAGLMAAGQAGKGNQSVALLDGNEKFGKKIYITGKGRCNVTNLCEKDEFLNNVVNNPKFLMSALSQFSPADAMLFFAENGAPLMVERGNRVFPVSEKASDITNALIKFASKNNVQFFLNNKVISVNSRNEKFVVCTSQNTFICNKLIIATGGLSYPATGCTGFGLEIATGFSHNISPSLPALVPIVLKGNLPQELEGLSLKNVSLICEINGKPFKDLFGEMLFTANGISGPIVLSMSSFINKFKSQDIELYLDFKPALTCEQLDARLLREFENAKNKNLENIFPTLLLKRMIGPFFQTIGVDQTQKPNNFSKEQRLKLVNSLKKFPLNFEKLVALAAGIVTSGGVDVSQINPKTMESKLVKNLYFAGEVLNVDALTGGFNIQIALSTGFAAGKACGGKE